MAFTLEHGLRCRADFPALAHAGPGVGKLAYLDGPGGTQIPQAVMDAITDVYRSCNVNTHGQFPASQEIDRRMGAAREVLAAFLGAADASCISFGQNMTTLNYALSAAIAATLRPGDEILITELDHEANRGPWLRFASEAVAVKQVRLLSSGGLDCEDMAAKLNERTKVFAIGASSNALGTVNDIQLARRLTRSVGALLIVDAVHYAPHFPLDVQALDADFLLCSAYKFYGPHVGVLYSKPGALRRLPTQRLEVQDPAAPYRIETGTLNHAAIHGARAAVEYLAAWGNGESLRARIVDAMHAIAGYEHELARSYYEAVRALPRIEVWGPDFSRPARAPTVSITIEGIDPAQAAAVLGRQGICIWDGNFYAARAVEVLGLASRGGLLRTGISMYNTPEDIQRLLAGIEKMVA